MKNIAEAKQISIKISDQMDDNMIQPEKIQYENIQKNERYDICICTIHHSTTE